MEKYRRIQNKKLKKKGKKWGRYERELRQTEKDRPPRLQGHPDWFEVHILQNDREQELVQARHKTYLSTAKVVPKLENIFQLKIGLNPN